MNSDAQTPTLKQYAISSFLTAPPTKPPTPTPEKNYSDDSSTTYGDGTGSVQSSKAGGVRPICQCASKLNPGTGKCVCNSGCAVMAGHMALDYIRKFYTHNSKFQAGIKNAMIDFENPLSTYAYYVKRGWSSCGNGTAWGWKDWMVNDLGIQSVKVNLVNGGVFNIQRANEYINKKCVIIASSPDHVFIVDSVVSVQNKIIGIHDSGFGCYTNPKGDYVEDPSKVVGPVLRTYFTSVNLYAHPVCPPGVE